MNAFLFLCIFKPFCHIRNKEIPIKKYKVIQTGPNIQLGGFNEGLLRSKYQLLIELIVKIEPITPES